MTGVQTCALPILKLVKMVKMLVKMIKNGGKCWKITQNGEKLWFFKICQKMVKCWKMLVETLKKIFCTDLLLHTGY